MSISQEIVERFQRQIQKVLAQLAQDYNLQLVQEDEISFKLVANGFYVRMYLYPSHIPSVNLTIIPTGSQWTKWRRDSPWGMMGIWLAHLVAFRKSEIRFPDTRFRTAEELDTLIETLVQLFRASAVDLLQGDTTLLPVIASYADDRVLRKAEKRVDHAGKPRVH